MVNLSIVRKHIEMLYLDRCDIIEFQKVEEDGLTYMKEVVIQSDVPCKLSHESLRAIDGELVPGKVLISKLLLSLDIEVKAGSKITVYRNGNPTHYECSGEPAMFHNHQEIWLKLLEGYA